ncbi:MAG TPA: hypothetical protein VML95_02070 [Longimicrobiales bacterium]|nr:hypothetical protein [Longimicrobiales bacterium]
MSDEELDQDVADPSRDVHEAPESDADGFRYDVAISFLQDPDVDVALELAEKLRAPLGGRVFCSPERQALISGENGPETFARIFRRETRVAVVLYRPTEGARLGWGETSYTQLEEDAITGMAINDGRGLDVVVLLSMAEDYASPAWYSDGRSGLHFPEFGIDGAAAVTLERVRRVGGLVRQESAIQMGVRLWREHQAEEERRRILGGGYPGFQTALTDLVALLERLANELKEATGGEERIEFARDYYGPLIYYRQAVFTWTSSTNVGPPFTFRAEVKPNERLFRAVEGGLRNAWEGTFLYDVGLDGRWGWRPADGRALMSSEAFADLLLKRLLEWGQDLYASGAVPRRV